MSQPAKICMQKRYYEEQVHRVPLELLLADDSLVTLERSTDIRKIILIVRDQKTWVFLFNSFLNDGSDCSMIM